MKCTGIIAEYNPFHNGHRYHIEKAKELTGAQYVIVVMSGSFVQRGDVAVCDKFTRTRQALLGGADIVISLPTPFSLSSAELFARAGVTLLRATGLVDSICFGSACGDLQLLNSTAKKIYCESAEFKGALAYCLGSGASYPRALAKALGPEMSAILSDPNDILAVEYLKALLMMGSPLTPYTIKRSGPAHDTSLEEGGFASAGMLRTAIAQGSEELLYRCMPEASANAVMEGIRSGTVPRENARLSQALLYKLRSMSAEDISHIPDVSEGLENLIYRAAHSAYDYDTLLAAIKTKRYTMARIKRILMSSLLGIGRQHRDLDRLYIRVLGVRKDALILLSRLAEKASLPVIARYSERERLSPGAMEVCDIDIFAYWLASMASPSPMPPKFDYTSPLIMV